MSELVVLAAPLDGATEGRLVIRRGLGDADLGSDTMAELYTARCIGRAPRARCSGGTVELTYPLSALTPRRQTDVITLNSSIPWEIDVGGGVGDVRADLTGVLVRSIDVEGDTARTTVALSHPEGTVPIRLGAVRDTTIRRPARVPVRVRIRRGGRRITVDDQTLAASTGPTTITSPGYLDAAYRVNVTVESADHLTVTTTGRNELAGASPADVMLAARTWLDRFGPAGVRWPAEDGATSESNRSVA